MFNIEKTCIEVNSLISSLVISDKYIAIGDVKANKVDIYIKDINNLWKKEREIHPPVNSIPYKVGNGFGGNLKLDRNTLMIDATTVQPTANVDDPGNFHVNEILNSIFYGKYFIRLDKQTEVITLYFPLKQKEDFYQFYILYEGKPELITLPNNQKALFSDCVAVHKNRLLVGCPSNVTGGSGWLFDLTALNNSATELTVENAYLGDSVAISEQFAIVGHSGRKTYDFIDDDILHPKTLYPKTLIKSLKNSSSFVLDTSGYLSLDKNVLAIMRPGSYSSSLTQLPHLQVYYLDEDSTPNLILDHKHSKDWILEENVLLGAKVQNGYLVTIEDINYKTAQICITPIEQIISK